MSAGPPIYPEFDSVNEAWLYLAVSSLDELLTWIALNRHDHTDASNFFLIEYRRCRDLSSLFTDWHRMFSIPDYFGHNWDVWTEVMGDLYWLPRTYYVCIIADASLALQDEPEELSRYYGLMDGIVKWWHARMPPEWNWR
jgi:hypothetical protein